nr:MAG TPA: hypothetical protein [Caudoviricetes sp.]
MSKYDSILFGDGGTPSPRTKYDDILFGAPANQPTDNTVGEVVSTGQENPTPTAETKTSEFDLNAAMKRYGINPEFGRNALSYEALNERMKQDGLADNPLAVLAVQQEWRKSLARFGELTNDEAQKERIAKKLQEIDEAPETKVERTTGNVVSETFVPRVNAAASEMDAAVTRTANTALSFANDEDYKEAVPAVEKAFPKAAGKVSDIYRLVMNARQAEKMASANPMADVNTFTDALFDLEDYGKKNGFSRDEMEKIADRYYSTANALREQKTMDEYNRDDKNKVKYTRAELEELGVEPKYLDGSHFTRDEQGNYLLTQDQEAGVKRAYSNKRADRVAGLQQRRQELQDMGLWDFTKQALATPFGQGFGFNDAAEWFGQMLESSVSQAPERAAQLGLAILSRGGSVADRVLGQVLWNSGTNMRLDTREAFTSTMEEKAKEHGWDMNMLTVDQFSQLEKEAIADGSLPKSIEEAQLGSLARSTNELLTTGGLEGASEMLRKAAKQSPGKARKLALSFLGIVAGTFAEPMGEVQGDVADALVKQAVNGEELDLAKAYKGAGNTFMASLFSAENAIQRATKIHAVMNERRAQAQAQAQAQAPTDKPTPSQEVPADNTTPTENAPETKSVEATEAQTQERTPDENVVSQEGEVVTPAETDTEAQEPVDRRALMEEYERITSKIKTDEDTLSAEDQQRIQDIESMFTSEYVTEDGEIITNNDFAKAYRDWKNNEGEFAPVGETDASRENNRVSEKDVDGTTDERGINLADNRGTQRRSETNEPIQTVETETTSAGHNQSDEGVTTDLTEQPNHNQTESDTTGLDGRTGETVSGRGEHGELGQDGSQQSDRSAQTTSETRTDSGVQQRSQSDSVGETLEGELKDGYVEGLTPPRDNEIFAEREALNSDYIKKADKSAYRGTNIPSLSAARWAIAVTKGGTKDKLVEAYLDNKPQQHWAKELGLSDHVESAMIHPYFASTNGLIKAYENTIAEVDKLDISDANKKKLKAYFTSAYKRKHTLNMTAGNAKAKSDKQTLDNYFKDKDAEQSIGQGLPDTNRSYEHRNKVKLDEINLYVGGIDFELSRPENLGGIYATSSPALASTYAEKNGNVSPDKRKMSRIKISHTDDVLVIDAKGAIFNRIKLPDGSVSTTDKIIARARKQGYKVVVIKNNIDIGGRPSHARKLSQSPADTVWVSKDLIKDRADITNRVDIEGMSHYVGNVIDTDGMDYDPKRMFGDDKGNNNSQNRDAKRELATKAPAQNAEGVNQRKDETNPDKAELLDKIKQVKGKPTPEQVSALREDAREKDLARDLDVRNAIHKLANKLDDEAYDRYAQLEKDKLNARREQAYKEFEEAISKPHIVTKEKGSTTPNRVAAFEKENRINNAIDSAVAQQEEQAKPYLKEFKGGDLRQNQKRAHELLKENPKHAEQIKEAFFARTPTARSSSWGVVERGYIKYSTRNPQHNAFKGTRDGLLGFDFDGNAVYGTAEMVFDDIKNSNTAEDIAALTLAEQPQDAREMTDTAVNNVLRNAREHEQAAREAVVEFAKENNIRNEDGSAVEGTNEDLAWASNHSDFMDWVKNKSEALHKLFKKVQNILASVIAIVAVGAMTVPQDAHAQAGFSVYENGPKIENVSQDASNTIHWVTQNHDNGGKVFVVADKNEGKIHIVDNNGKVLDTQNAIFGRNKSNENVANSTPSGRFKLQKALTTKAADKRIFGDDVLVLTDTVTGKDITKADGGVIAMHRLWNKPERVKAINSATASDNYMSAGCINVPTAFYNSAVDNLDGAMVYILDNKDAPKSEAKVSNMSNAKAKTSAVSKTKNETSNLSHTPKQGKFGVSKVKFSTADLNSLDTSLTKEKVATTLRRILGTHADKVTVISRNDFNSVQAEHYIYKNGIEGFYDQSSGNVYIVADGIYAQNGLTAEDRVGFVAWHELTHLGLDTKYGQDLTDVLDTALANPTIAKLAQAIQLERINRGEAVSVNEHMAAEEALAELNAALKTDNVKALEDRYGIKVDNALQTEKATDGFFQRIRNIIRKVLGKPVMTNQQVKDLFAALDEQIAKHADPDVVAATARLQAFAHNVEEGVNLDTRYSIQSAKQAITDYVANAASAVADKLTGKTQRGVVADPAGFNPNSIDTTKVQKQEVRGALTQRERFHEAFVDSQYSAIKYIGGYSTELAHAIKTTTNAVNHQQKKFQQRNYAFSDKLRALAKKRDDLYTSRKNRHAIDTDVMVVTTSLAAITKTDQAMSENESIRNKYHVLLNGFDFYDNRGQLQHKNGILDELANYGWDRDTQEAPTYTPYQRKKLAELETKAKEYEEILRVFDENKNKLLNEDGLTREEALTQRKNWRGHNGMTNADAYNVLTKAVQQGKVDLTYKGKPWLDYIADVGFTVDKGFKDTSKDYTLDYKDLVVDGFLADSVREYAQLSQDMYAYQHKHLGKELTGQANMNPFFTPTMGKAKDIKTKSNMVGDTFYIEENRTIEQRIDDAVAAEWQGQHMGRAWTGSGALQNLNMLAALSAKRVGQNALGKMIYEKGGKGQKGKGEFAIRVVTTLDENFGAAKGYLITRDGANGQKQYIKVSLDNDLANDALFGDNVVTPNGFLLDVARNMRSLVSVMITMMPGFSLVNAYKGWGEKKTQIKAMAANGKVDYFFKELGMKEKGLRLEFAKDLFTNSYRSLLRGFFKEGYFRATVAYALSEGDKAPKDTAFRRWLLSSPQARQTFDKLTKIGEAGGLATRADSFQFSAQELQRAYEKNGIQSAIARKIANAQNRALTLTMAMEYASTLAMVDTLQAMGMPEKKAIEANLWFMNFNDKGASGLSSVIRSTVPFGNATIQGSRSTTRGLETKNGLINGLRQAVFRAAFMAVAALAMELLPCEDGGEPETLRDYNSGELMRATPIKIGCYGTLKMPIAYGADMVYSAIGTAAYQLAAGNWSLKESYHHVIHALTENMNVAPTPPGDTNIFETALAPITPVYAKFMYNTLRDRDDFGNKLSRQGSDNLKEKWAAGKNTTAPAWTWVARGLNSTGVNLTPEQTRYLVSGFAQPLAGMIDAINKPLTNKSDLENPALARAIKIAQAATGSRTFHKPQQSPSQRTYAQVSNNLRRYKDIDDIITVYSERKGEDALKFGAASANTQSWLKKRIADGTFDKADEAKIKVILEYRKRQKRISSSKLDSEAKNQKYYESNLQYLREMHALEDAE